MKRLLDLWATHIEYLIDAPTDPIGEEKEHMATRDYIYWFYGSREDMHVNSEEKLGPKPHDDSREPIAYTKNWLPS